jgi:mono/diheme cytochrome c family protein
MKRLAAALLGGLLQAAVATAAPVSFQRDVLPIFKQHCMACHISGEEQGGLALAPRLAHASLVGVPSRESALLRVKPGQPEASYLVRKIDGTHQEAGGSGVQMPMGDAGLDAAARETIRRWVVEGAGRD